ncbi:MAG: DUF4402 domain-containing protein [Gemmatimonadota bacterium]|jgi:hypothetical protein
MTTRMATWGLLALLTLGIPADARGQGRPLRVRGEQDLAFGELLAGIATTVAPTDPLGAARLQISGAKDSDVLVSFFLPVALLGPGGAALPLSFGPGSAGYSPDRSIETQLAFDPAVPSVLQLPGNGRGLIYLGGTALTPSSIPAGSYDATITVTISYVGN